MIEKSNVYNYIHKDVEIFFRNTKINSFFFSLKLIEFISKIVKLSPNFFCLYKKKKIKAIIPFFERKDPKHGKILNSLPFFGSMGGIYSNNEEDKKVCLNLFDKYCSSKEIVSSVIIQNPFSKTNFSLENFFLSNLKDDRILQYIELENKLKISNTRIRNIKKATKLGFKVFKSNNVKVVDKLELLHKIHMKSISGNPKPKIFFTKQKKLDKKIWKIYYSKNKSNDIIAMLLVFFENKSMEYYIPVSDKKYKDTQVLSLLTYNSIMDAVKANYKFYSFGFTWLNQKGVYEYKKKWGCEDKKIEYLIKYKKDKLHNLKEMIEFNKFFYIAPYKK